jgi:hypothetical protein
MWANNDNYNMSEVSPPMVGDDVQAIRGAEK